MVLDTQLVYVCMKSVIEFVLKNIRYDVAKTRLREHFYGTN